MLGNFLDAQKVSKANIEAAIATFSKTTQAVATEFADYSKRSFENSTKAIEELFGVKSLDKAIEVQNKYAQTLVQDYSVQLTKVGQLYADFAKDAFKPFETKSNGSAAK